MEKLNRETVAAMNDPSIRSKLEEVGFVVVANRPEEFSRFIQDEIAKWGDTVMKSGVKMDRIQWRGNDGIKHYYELITAALARPEATDLSLELNDQQYNSVYC